MDHLIKMTPRTTKNRLLEQSLRELKCEYHSDRNPKLPTPNSAMAKFLVNRKGSNFRSFFWVWNL